jgi:hypothetical protein
MAIHRAGRWTGVATALLSVGFLVPTDASAQAIRVLLVIPREPSELARQAARLGDTIAESGGHMVLAETLGEADAIVQLTGHRYRLAETGESEDFWDAQFKLLTPPVRRFPVPVAERFTVLLIGRDEAELPDLLAQALEHALAKALGREVGKSGPAWNESI